MKKRRSGIIDNYNRFLRCIMAKTVKMQDIAEKLGVSTMTVSKALSGKSGVSEQTRQRIKELAEEMGYVLPAGEREGEKRSYNVGVILADYYSYSMATFYWKLYQEICTNAVQNNCFVILEMISPSDEANENLPKMVSENKVDGVIVLGNMKKSYLERLEKTKVPVVFMDFYNMDICEDSVISNSFYGTYKITNYLFRKGHRDIAFVGNIHTTMSIMDRFLGYEKSLISHGIKLREDWIISDRESERVSYEDINLPEQMPTAFVCNCDQTASTLINCLKKAGYRVPEDISVVGYDDYLYPGLCDVGITTYGVNMTSMALKGIRLMIEKVEDPGHKKGTHIMDGYLVERDSVKEYR